MKMLAWISTFLISVGWQNTSKFEKLFALQGLWRMEKPGGALFEEWTKIDNTRLQGRSFVVKGNDTLVGEKIYLARIRNSIFYIPSVQDQNSGLPVSFKLISDKQRQFVFENKEHDYPQRIIYRFVNKDSVVARIEGRHNGNEKWSEFYFSRVK